MPIVVFLSTVSDEFRAYRDQLSGDLTRHNVAVKVQEDFKDLGGDTLDKLDVYIAYCDAVVHLVGDMCGAAAGEREQRALMAKRRDLTEKLPPLGQALEDGACLPYTQWEAWLALYHGKPLMIAKANAAAPRGPKYAPSDDTCAAQAAHLERLKGYHRYSCVFANPDDLAKHIAYSAILDLLVGDYAEKYVRQRDVAEGFIKEMAERVAGDAALDLDGMKQAVRNAIEIYEREIAGRPVETNLDEIVNRALARAKDQVDKGQSALARATLRRAAEEMRRDEEERRERYIAGVTALYTQARDIALAAYDGDAAAEAVVELARALQNVSATKIATFLSSEAAALERHGDERGSNVHLFAAIALRQELLRLAVSDDERGAAHTNLGVALGRLGERESGTARLEEAVQAFRAALEELTRERVPLNWAITQIQSRQCARKARRAGRRDSPARRGGRRLSGGAPRVHTRSGPAPMGDDTEQSRQRAFYARGAGGAERRASRRRSQRIARRSRKGRGIGFRASGRRHRTISAVRYAPSAISRAGRRLSRTRSRRIVRRWRSARASGSRSNGRRHRQISAMRSEGLASGRAVRRSSRRRSQPTARRWRNERASGSRSTGRRVSAIRGSR